MSQLLRGFSARNGKEPESKRSPEEVRETWPGISQALEGIPDETGKAWILPPCKLGIFLSEGKLKFCLNCPEAKQVAFGVVEDPSKPLDSIEQALNLGRLEWVPHSGKR